MKVAVKVPFLDLKGQYAEIRGEVAAAIQEVLESAAFAGGPAVERFEEKFAAFCGSAFCVGVGSGTAALWLALKGLGVGEGDEVITVPNTFIATAEAISFCGARPVFVDVDEKTYTMDPELIEAALTARTKAIVPVHLYGQTADMDPIMEIARARGIHVVEDAAQAQGAEYKGRRAGSIGHAGCFSFYPGKNLGAYGEAGAVTTDDPGLAGKVRMLRDHGQSRKYFHSMIGWNSRMDGIQGAVLEVKLKRLFSWNEARRSHARRYEELLAGVAGVTLPCEAEYARHIYHIYALRTPERARVMDALEKNGIACAMHYPVPVHLQEAYRFLGLGKGSFPVAEMCCREELSLPMFAELKDEQIEQVAEAIRDLF